MARAGIFKLAASAIGLPGLHSASPRLLSSSAASSGSKFLVISLSGPDKLGIVHRMTRTVADHGGNVEQSRMAILGGEFAIISMVMVQALQASEMIQALESSFPNYHIHFRETTQSQTVVGNMLYKLALEGPDSVGIMAMLTEEMAKAGVNIHDLETELTTAAFAGFPLFKVKGTLHMKPDGLPVVLDSISKVEKKFGMTGSVIQSER
uniref:ACT domain-containing protein n=1 Tax=Compsopogon caeruleus TaxID=31354 RepID=A0A7S1XEU8_9RHOD|mmetsp:Transcript_4509/g.9001  ORF Transcript_4509/g.9001 Transcript_4509/m.9001 type:complete len:208 (+) Transcript_4509:286-909(+)